MRLKDSTTRLGNSHWLADSLEVTAIRLRPAEAAAIKSLSYLKTVRGARPNICDRLCRGTLRASSGLRYRQRISSLAGTASTRAPRPAEREPAEAQPEEFKIYSEILKEYENTVRAPAGEPGPRPATMKMLVKKLPVNKPCILDVTNKCSR